MTSQTTTTNAGTDDPATTRDAPPTAPTEPLPPAAQTPPPFHPAGVAPPTHGGSGPGDERTPWYRRAWVLAVGALVAALMFFGAGFVAGNAAALFNGVSGDRAGVPVGPGFGGDRDGDGFAPGGGRPGMGEPDDRPGFGDQDGDDDGGTGTDS